ncbi:hemerythrin family protein [Patescibacteria group bacterium]|nr:hemerythrin family protein [Patescibacteria group bacterium]
MTIAWTPNLTVHESTIDAQHKQLLAEIQVLLETILAGQGKEQISSILNFLSNYIAQHFFYEENYMQEHSYPGLETHKAIHERFNLKYEEFKLELLREGETEALALKIENFLGKWWIEHITYEDHKYDEYISTHQA